MKVVWQIVLFTGIISPGCVGANHYCGEECRVQILQIGIFPQQIAAFILHTLEHILTSILSSKQNKLFNLVAYFICSPCSYNLYLFRQGITSTKRALYCSFWTIWLFWLSWQLYCHDMWLPWQFNCLLDCHGCLQCVTNRRTDMPDCRDVVAQKIKVRHVQTFLVTLENTKR